MAIELVKENIGSEQLLGENSVNSVIQEEYIIPDTQPDVIQILLVDAKPSIVNKEVMQDKVYIEGQLEFDVLYLGKIEDRTEVCGVAYSTKFVNYVDIDGAAYKMIPDAECYVEHMNCTAINERKISVEGIIEIKSEVYKASEVEIVKDVSGLKEVQFLKSPTSLDKAVGNSSLDLIAKSHIQIPMDKPQIANILKCDVNIHKKGVKLLEDKIQVEAFAEVNVLYKGKDNREVTHVFDDVLITQEADFEGVNSNMTAFANFKIDAMEYSIKEDDLGESRNLEVETLIKVDIRITEKVDLDVIEDAYSPELILNIEKKDHKLNLLYGHSNVENIVKENIDFKEGQPKPTDILMNVGKICITDKKLIEDKVIVEGIIKAYVLYNTGDEEKYVNSLSEDIPFSSSVEIPGCKIDMTATAKASLENLEASIEANTVAIKAIVSVNARVNYYSNKNFLVDVVPEEGQKPEKKASITIYAVQPGDTLWKVAKMYNTTTEAIVKINSIEDPDTISVGEKLIIPGRAVI